MTSNTRAVCLKQQWFCPRCLWKKPWTYLMQENLPLLFTLLSSAIVALFLMFCHFSSITAYLQITGLRSAPPLTPTALFQKKLNWFIFKENGAKDRGKLCCCQIWLRSLPQTKGGKRSTHKFTTKTECEFTSQDDGRTWRHGYDGNVTRPYSFKIWLFHSVFVEPV